MPHNIEMNGDPCNQRPELLEEREGRILSPESADPPFSLIATRPAMQIAKSFSSGVLLLGSNQVQYGDKVSNASH